MSFKAVCLVDDVALIRITPQDNVDRWLMHAVLYNAPRCVQFLIAAGATVHQEVYGHYYGTTLLEIASYNANSDVCRMLIEAGALIYVYDPAYPLRWGPLFSAIRNNRVATVHLLIDRGEDAFKLYYRNGQTMPYWVVAFARAKERCRKSVAHVIGLGRRVRVAKDVFQIMAKHLWSMRLSWPTVPTASIKRVKFDQK